jgi:hypothetical protein
LFFGVEIAMPRSKTALTPVMERILQYIYDNLSDVEFSKYQIPRTILKNAYSNPLKALVKRGILIELNERYRLKNQKL